MGNPTLADMRKLGIRVPIDVTPRSVFTIDPGTRAITFDVPVKTKTETNNDDSWRKKQKRVKEQFAAVDRAMAGLQVPPLPIVVTFTRRSPALMDCDNLPSAPKHIRDRIAELYGVGDSPKDPIRWVYQQEPCKAGDYGVRVTIVRAA